MNQGGSDSQFLVIAALKGAKGTPKGKGNGLIDGNGLRWNCGTPGHFASKCFEPPSGKGQFRGEQGGTEGNGEKAKEP